ncbi:MAG: protein kinase, partial [Bryobacterales bacterium]|nr:protein kinase [Bryobacterales bacterium]
MSPERWRELRELFNEAEEIPADELSDWLDRKCGDDRELRHEVQVLLQNKAEAESFLSEPLQRLGPIDLELKTGDVIGERFEIEALAGTGGMGEVYRAYDRRLQRTVAIKRLPEALSQDADRRRRFEREARAVARLGHQNICTLHDFGADGGRDYLVLEYLEGETLAKRLESGPLGFEELRKIAVEVLEALACAHAAGIVHRDLKPGNIMLTPTGTKLLDFGIARQQQQQPLADGDAVRSRTQTTGGQTVVGTLAYMSPEQAEGKPVDARSDLFSFGCVLYEMICGRRAFVGDSAISVVAAVVRGEPESLNHTVPKKLRDIIRKCLRKDPAARFQSAEEVADVLQHWSASRLDFSRRTALTVGAVVIVIAAAGALLWKGLGTRRTEAVPAVLVLPFVNVSKDAELEYLADGLSESIINSLSRMGSFRVLPRATAFTYKNREPNIEKFRAELGVDKVVLGRLSRRAGSLRVQAELVDAVQQTQLWGQQYEGGPDDILRIEGEIVKAVGGKLRSSAKTESATRTRPATQNAEAYQLYLRGRQAFVRASAPDLRKALNLFRQALDLDPQYALAYVGIADAYWGLSGIEMKPSEAMPKARAAAN